jgi:hypothetical protein
LARASLGVLLMAFCQSCIVADPPEFRDPVRTRPVLNTYSAVPSPRQVLVRSPGQQAIDFAIDVQSEDAGEPLGVRFILDYGTPNPPYARSQSYAASTYDQVRTISLPWLPPTNLTGCHVLSMIVAHANTFEDSDSNQLIPERAALDAAIMNWWVNFVPPGPGQNTLVDCPDSLPTVP